VGQRARVASRTPPPAVQDRRAGRHVLALPDEVAHDGASSWPHVIARQHRSLGGGDQAAVALSLVAAGRR